MFLIHQSHAVCYPRRTEAICGRGGWLLHIADRSGSRRVPATTTIGRFLRPSPHLCCPLPSMFSFKHFSETSPLRNDTRFWQCAIRRDQTRRHHGFVLQTVASFHRPRLAHYYGIIRHLTPHGPVLESPLEPTLPTTTSDRTMPGFPSYCAVFFRKGSLLAIASSGTTSRCS